MLADAAARSGSRTARALRSVVQPEKAPASEAHRRKRKNQGRRQYETITVLNKNPA
ncbi:hypothetical protein ACFSL6_27205 [Paenibacillus thailandensis]|uniref:hypothetical protein n=1 Tax=Paenibacillus thailandensis TaxID=393250 RepID=UPI00363A91A2